jgi:RNA polymerase sigma-70 factor (ECF subfamily)
MPDSSAEDRPDLPSGASEADLKTATFRPLENELSEALRAVGVGQWQAWSKVVSLVAPRALRYARFLTEHDADAEDVVQQTLTRLARQPSVLQLAEHPWAYFLRMVRNEAIRFRSRHQRRVPTEYLAIAEFASHRHVADPLETAERQQLIQAALSSLPPDQAEVVVLKFWEGMTFQEIAAVTSESPNTAASRYRYAIAKLANLLRSLEGEAIHV